MSIVQLFGRFYQKKILRGPFCGEGATYPWGTYGDTARLGVGAFWKFLAKEVFTLNKRPPNSRFVKVIKSLLNIFC